MAHHTKSSGDFASAALTSALSGALGSDATAAAAAGALRSLVSSNATVSADEESTTAAPLHHGVILKQSDHLRTWNKRYLELHPTFLRSFDGVTNGTGTND